MSQSLFEYDEMEFLKLDDAKIECLNYFGFVLSKNKHTYHWNQGKKPVVVYIKQLNKMTLLEVFDFISEKTKC